jgi:AcrR family transcriptional regulator
MIDTWISEEGNMDHLSESQPDLHENDGRERILQEAQRLFMEQGFASVSTRQICSAVGIKQPSLYYHFGSKEGLYLAVIQHWFEMLRVKIDMIIEDETTLRSRLHHIAMLFWDTSLGEYQAMQRDALHHLPHAHHRALYTSIWEAVIAPLNHLMKSGIDSGILPTYASPFILTQLFWAMVVGVGGLYHRGDPMPSPADNISVIDFFLAGTHGMRSEDMAAWPIQGDGLNYFIEKGMNFTADI